MFESIQKPEMAAEIHIQDYLYVFKKRKMIFFGFIALILLSAFVYLKVATPIYRAKSRVLIDRQGANVVDFQEVMTVDTNYTEYYQTQYKLFESRELADRVIVNLKLYEHEDFKKRPRSSQISYLLSKVRLRPISNSRLVDVRVEDPTPGRAQLICNTLVEAYLQRNLETQMETVRIAIAWLEGKLASVRGRVTESERAFQNYKEQNKIIQVPDINEENDYLRNMRLELAGLQAEKALLETRYRPTHPKLIQLNSKIKGFEAKIQEEVEETLGLNQMVIKLNELAREFQSNEQVYEALLTRFKETGITQELHTSNIVVIDRAELPLSPVKPNRNLVLLLAIAFGGFGATVLCFFLEYLDYNIKIPEDVKREGTTFLGAIPKATDLFRSGEESHELVALHDSHSTAAESFRAIRTSLLFSAAKTGLKTLMVTSPGPSEGKTFVVGNIAAVMAQGGQRVLLVDADLRKPRAHKLLGIKNSAGLSNYLAGSVSVEDLTQKSPIENLDVITAGPVPPNPSELLGTARMQEFIREAGESYDRILFDTSPFTAVTDPIVLSTLTDGVLVVTRFEKTRKRFLKQGKERFDQVNAKVLGAIINNVKADQQDYYYSQYYYYGYGEKKTAPGKKENSSSVQPEQTIV